MLSIQEAVNLIIAQATSFGIEQVSLDDALGRVLAENIYADRDYPPFNRATMDGYALQSTAFSEYNPDGFSLIEHLFAGSIAQKEVVAGTCIKIMTGAPVPAGADAVIRVEDSRREGDKVYFNTNNMKPWLNIARQGEDARQGNLIIPKDQLITTQIVSGLAVTGKAQVQVAKTPDVAVLSTGNEVRQVGMEVLPHQIRDSNTFAIRYFLKKFHIHSPASHLVADNKQDLKTTLQQHLNADIIILSGGVSKGDADYVPEVLASLGVQQVFHRVKIKPGAPLWFGKLPAGGVVFGLPGNPVSVQVGCKVFIESYLRTCFNLPQQQPLILPFLVSKNKKTPFDEYFPATILTKNAISGIAPTPYNSSGDVAATLNSDGIALHPESIDALTENTPVQFLYW
ncbi:molybdopterin molybdotransferase MoeA [Rhodocytophaga rosea]|uniref:Molybdopterin molybdenumtransferase n=1 Tax=Rhodocytophaga rosea TaxID=2704465 RepID=A0A6C0GRG9_9BACT|nr:molybdopterin molybdotransferase MoeA [Rhodocytophaga rosea]QHT70695.1 molybdopterin molybdotransferase MoeA [Rhodocytophaga rosea]